MKYVLKIKNMLGVNGKVNHVDSSPEYLRELRRKFISLCCSILYSDDQYIINTSYNMLFELFKTYIIYSKEPVCVSCFEEVIFKILKDENEGKYENWKKLTGDKYSPFIKFITLLRDQMNATNKPQDPRYPVAKVNLDLYDLLLMYDYEHSDEDHSYFMKLILNRTYEPLK